MTRSILDEAHIHPSIREAVAGSFDASPRL